MNIKFSGKTNLLLTLSGKYFHHKYVATNFFKVHDNSQQKARPGCIQATFFIWEARQALLFVLDSNTS